MRDNRPLIFAYRIREERKLRGWSVSQLAAKAHISKAYLYRIEQRLCPRVSVATALAIAEELDMPLDALLSHEPRAWDDCVVARLRSEADAQRQIARDAIAILQRALH